MAERGVVTQPLDCPGEFGRIERFGDEPVLVPVHGGEGGEAVDRQVQKVPVQETVYLLFSTARGEARLFVRN